ncbi:hypothetical protein SCUCBS95973_005550 [Sporothrix curviconia]|uniref:Cyclase n=1 Tax=Sporothrix curviconia TaxID=1260050 RepID=A0ABP0BYJ9_9PEZI
MATTKPSSIPAFEELPLRREDPPYSAWGLYGKDDELGTLNRLTDAVVVAAAQSEIRTGKRFCLDLPMEPAGNMTFFNRRKFHQEILRETPPLCCNDEIWTFNSQGGSQWDGLRHFAYQREAKFYNGITQNDIHGLDAHGQRTTQNGIQAMAAGGIVGRGVLLDYHGWLSRQPEDKKKEFDPLQPHAVTLEELLHVAADQGTEIRFGDILFVRTGFTLAIQQGEATAAALRASNNPSWCGVEQTPEMLRWIWTNFAAVAGDHPTFEVWPALPPALDHYRMHEILLSGWGMPIGELFALDALAEHCAATGRYSFFVTSEPCNVPGGIASPPNILAIF